MKARVFCVKEKRPGYLLIGCEPSPEEDALAFLNELDPDWTMEVAQILPQGNELVLLVRGRVSGKERGLAVRVPQGADPSAEALVAFAGLFGFKAPKREKLWFVIPREIWAQYDGKLTWEQAKDLAGMYQVEPRETYRSRAHEEISRRLSSLGWSESRLILELMEAGVLERAVPGLDFLTPEQAERALDFLTAKQEEGALPF